MHTFHKIITNRKGTADIFRRVRGGSRESKLALMEPENVHYLEMMAKIASYKG